MPRVHRSPLHAAEDEFVRDGDRLKGLESMQNPPTGFATPYASAYAASATSCANNAYTTIPLTLNVDGYGFAMSGGDLVIPVTGMYLIAWALAFAGSSTNGGFSLLSQNSTGVAQGSSSSFNGDPARQSTGARILACTEGDLISLSAWQNSGGALAIEPNTNRTFLDIFLFGPQ